VKTRSGIELGSDKAYLTESRLKGLAARFACADVGALLTRLRSESCETLWTAAVEAMTTNETSFFRDRRPFDLLASTLAPERLKPGRPLRLWSAACSTGQEPYSIAMTFDAMRRKGMDARCEIIATDLSEACLKRAKAGVYSGFEVGRGLCPDQLSRHFTRQGDDWKIQEALGADIRWRTLNLLSDSYGMIGLDGVFCRNVMIYFDRPTRTAILDRIHRSLNRDGFLFLGAAESAHGLHPGFRADPRCPGLAIKVCNA
jgi:chemotaxis protein methyltransferase CheR